jgi:hypothetical protein
MEMNLTLKDMLGIFAFTVGPLGTLILLMWHHFNSSINNLRGELGGLRGELGGLRGELTRIDEKLSGKIDVVRDRVSRIEGLLIFAKIMPSEEIKSKEVTDQKEVLEDTKGVTVSYAQKLQQEGRLEGIHQIVNRMLHDNEPIDKIIRWTGISKDAIKKLAF